jgi:hypothetical protein
VKPYATVPARPPTPRLVERAELERIRCEALSGIASASDVLRLLEHVGIHDTAIRRFAVMSAEGGSEAQREAAREAIDAVSADPPMHVRIEFDVATERFGAGSPEKFIATMQDWTIGSVADLADAAQVTVTYRGRPVSWEARLA